MQYEIDMIETQLDLVEQYHREIKVNAGSVVKWLEDD